MREVSAASPSPELVGGPPPPPFTTLAAPGPSQASSVGAPFTQCPAVGASPSCGILIVVNADRTVAVLGDSAVGPYDGGDDTLVGVQNNSSTSVDAITVSGPSGSGIFGFDSDGLCTYVSVPCGTYGYEGPGTTFVRDTANFDHGEVDFGSGGLAAGASAYFSLEGALNFAELTARQGKLAGRYVALGDSYSSGEGAVGPDKSRASAAFDPATDTTNLAKSDASYNTCHRSANAYPYAVKAAQGIAAANFTFHACSGAIMADFLATLPSYPAQWNDGSQLDAIGPAPQAKTGYLPPASLATTLVTLSIGGNDAGFADILANCIRGNYTLFLGNVLSSDSHCIRHAEADLARGQQLLNNGGEIFVNKSDNKWQFCGRSNYCALARKYHFSNKTVVTVPNLAGLLHMIQMRAPAALIEVLLYPHLFTSNPAKTCTVGTFHSRVGPEAYTLSGPEINEFNSLVDRLDGTIGGEIIAAGTTGVHVVPVDTAKEFAAHELCDTSPHPSPWLNGLIWEPGHSLTDESPFSFHPNALGQAQFGVDVNS